MTHPASIFPISALAVSAILLLSSCSNPSTVATQSVQGPDRLVTKSVVALIAQLVSDTYLPDIYGADVYSYGR